MIELPFPSFETLPLLGPTTLEFENSEDVFGVTARDPTGQTCRLTDFSWYLEPVEGSLGWRQDGSVVLHVGASPSGIRVAGFTTSWWLDVDATLHSPVDESLEILVKWLTRPITPRSVHVSWPSVSLLHRWMHDERIGTSDRYMEVEDSPQHVGERIPLADLDDLDQAEPIPTDRAVRFPMTVGVGGVAVAEFLAVTIPELIAGASAVAMYRSVTSGGNIQLASNSASQLWLLPTDGRISATWPY
jgi:hypothetical protein